MAEARISFLGTGAGQCIHRAHSAISVDCPDGTRVLLDAGSGNSLLKNGVRLGLLAQDFHHVLLSHQHGDHMGGLPFLQGQRTFADPDGSPLMVYSSETALQKVEMLFRATSITHAVDQDGVTTSAGQRVVRWSPVEESQVVDLSPQVKAAAFPVDHIQGAMGWTITLPGMTIVFSGDTRFCPRVAEAAVGATVLIHEVLSTQADQEATKQRGHATAAEAAQIASEAGVSQLIITHIDSAFHHDPQPLVDEARRFYDGPISVASDRLQVTVRS